MAVPVGQQCLWCQEGILPSDRGEETVYADGGALKIAYIHIECRMRQVLGGPGHLSGQCSCCGSDGDPDMGMSPRAAALWVWRWVYDHGTVSGRTLDQ
jgi:hypothetical protein